MTYSMKYLLQWIIKRILTKKGSQLKLDDVENENRKKEEASQHKEIKKEGNQEKFSPQEIENTSKKSRAANLVKKIGRVLGLQFFIIKLEGNQIEMTFMSFVGLKYTSSYSADIVSSLFCVGFLIYYTAITICSLKMSFWIWKEVLAIQQKNKGKDVYHSALGKHIDLKESPYPILSYAFEDLKVPNRYWKLLLPVAVYVKITSTCIIITFLIGQPWLQILMVGLMETLMQGYTLLSNSRASRSEHWSDVLMRIFTILYLVFKLITTMPTMTEKTRQINWGIPMAACLVAIMLIGMGFILYILVYMVIDGIKTLIAKLKALRDLRRIMNEEKN